MNNEWKIVLSDAILSIADRIRFNCPNAAKELEQIIAASGSEPVPPAGDVEAVVLVVRHGPMGSDGLPTFVRAETLPDAPYDIENLPDGFELVDRAHVTRLTAERDGLKDESDTLEHHVIDLKLANSHLQSELTKALEDLRLEKVAGAAMNKQAEDFKTLSWERGQELTKARELLIRLRNCKWIPTAEWQHEVSEVIAHQSAPAAKGGKCWSCKQPLTIAQWQEADGNCPHCDAEIEGAEGLKP